MLERDAGFCSGSSELGDDYQPDRLLSTSPTSPTDSSDDSIEIKLMPISIPKIKRKAHEPSLKIACNESDVPLKKRIKFDSMFSSGEWRTDRSENVMADTLRTRATTGDTMKVSMNLGEILARHPGVTTLHRVPTPANDQLEPLALITKKTPTASALTSSRVAIDTTNDASSSSRAEIKTTTKSQADEKNDTQSETSLEFNSHASSSGQSRPMHQRNYKNMTRERRIEANARERTRVHTISAAFDTLRHAIPAYSNSQKLSKLSVLRVACSYIMTLSRMAGEDYSPEQNQPSVAECLEEVTKTIQTEGKVRKRKDEWIVAARHPPIQRFTWFIIGLWVFN